MNSKEIPKTEDSESIPFIDRTEIEIAKGRMRVELAGLKARVLRLDLILEDSRENDPAKIKRIADVVSSADKQIDEVSK